MPADAGRDRSVSFDKAAVVPLALRRAVPIAPSRNARTSVRRHRLLRWFAALVTIALGTVAILIAAAAAVMMGIS